jgi:hypothetical protein
VKLKLQKIGKKMPYFGKEVPTQQTDSVYPEYQRSKSKCQNNVKCQITKKMPKGEIRQGVIFQHRSGFQRITCDSIVAKSLSFDLDWSFACPVK